MKVKALYISVWDGGFEIASNCEIDLKTKEVTNVEQIDATDVDFLDEELIRLNDGTEIRDFEYDGDKYIDGQRQD